ncbi:MAG: gamma carbonic anhydrase family protein [Deltaproteobacteria bacterium HGW-Deltaproteobacteria-15]|nr:MAG: gamma carbonic anhydrase family protein [Deltaproteobacteria bacterium HGW-Deltaproteobacteria-15]
MCSLFRFIRPGSVRNSRSDFMIRSFNGKSPRIADSAFVSEAAYIIGDVEIGENSGVMPSAVIRADMGKITIGSSVFVEDNCVIHSGSSLGPNGDVVIGDRVLIGHGAVLNCRSIGSHVLVGMNATLLHNADIGNYCIIAACAMVTQGMKVPDRSFVVGVPGKIAGPPTEDQLWWVKDGITQYAQLLELYKKEKFW